MPRTDRGAPSPPKTVLAGAGTSTYVQTVERRVYTATVIDLYSRKVVGYAVADHPRTSLIVEACRWPRSVTRLPAWNGVIFHSYRPPRHLSGIRRFLHRERCCPVDGTARDLLR